jgi:sialic acid synthase SpsE
MAEIGVNHDGDPGRSHAMVDAADAAGFDAVKFQYWILDELLAADAPNAAYQGAGDQRDLLAGLALPLAALRALKDQADDLGVTFVCTADGERALRDVLTLEPAVLKIGSGDVDNPWLLDAAVHAGLPLLVSVGMTTDEELDRILARLGSLDDVVVLHCVSAYPTSLPEANLARIPDLAARTGRPVGLSDHTLGVAAAAAALALGAGVVEKHVTWSPSATGPDHAASLALDAAPDWVGTLRDLARGLSATRSADETANRPLVRKALHTLRDLPAGHVLAAGDLVPLRPLLDGIPALDRDAVVGRVLARPLAAGARLVAADLGPA